VIRRAPIVLVGGFTVWGREEAFGIKYWGGPGRDIQEDLKAHGFPAVTAAPGPVSSNWDRAAEVYAQVRGGTVDYGAAHAQRFGHARFGRTYPGLLPEGAAHFVGHSMGGQTIRVLAHLLAEGSEEERRATPEGLSPLFLGGQPGVLSLTTLATPHRGTTLARNREALAGVARRIFALAGGMGSPAVYDLKLDHWGIQRHPGESWKAYRKSILANPLWTGTQDFSAWDLSPRGAWQLNDWVRLPARVHAFSWSCAKTRPGAGGYQVPAPRMNIFWRPGARFMGRPQEGYPVDPSWFRNDGVVNTASMAGPDREAVEPYDGVPPRPGLWNHMGLLDGWDHSEILGMGPEHQDEVLPFYRALAGFLEGIQP
jgi:triacylglycerol lipase